MGLWDIKAGKILRSEEQGKQSSIMRIDKLIVLALTVSAVAPASFANDGFCTDEKCKALEKQYYKEEYKNIVSTVDPKEQYSEGSRFYIGMSYVNLAEKASSFAEKDKFYRQAISVKYYPAYMSLYGLYLEKNPEIALGFLMEYLKTNPDDPAPFVTAGKVDLEKGNYKNANRYLRRARALSNGHTAEIDWLLFKTNYILGNYKFAREMFESASAQSRLTDNIRDLRSDPRFAGIEDRPEFKEYKELFGR